MAIGNFLTTIEAAAIIGVSDVRVRQLYRQGRLPGQKVGTQILFDRAHVQQFAKVERPPGRPKESS